MNYTAQEVVALLEHWQEFRHSPRLWVLVRYADLSVAISNMPPHEYQAVLLVGMCGLEYRDAAQEMGVGTMTMHRRYQRGIAWLTAFLNGGTNH